MGLLQAAGAVGSSLIQASSAKRINRQQLQYNKWALQNEQQFQRDQSKWIADYNSPEHQMQRLKAAGLNPNLAYGSLGDSSMQDASSPSALGYNPQMPFGDLTQSFASILTAIGTYKKNMSDANLNDIDADTRDDKNKSEIEKNKASAAYDRANIELTGEQKQKVMQETRNLQFTAKYILPKESELKFQEIQKIMNDMQNANRITAAECAKIKQLIVESKQNVKLSKMQSAYLDKQIKKYDDYMDSIIQLNGGNWSLVDKQSVNESLKNDILQSMQSGDVGSMMHGLLIKKLLGLF